MPPTWVNPVFFLLLLSLLCLQFFRQILVLKIGLNLFLLTALSLAACFKVRHIAHRIHIDGVQQCPCPYKQARHGHTNSNCSIRQGSNSRYGRRTGNYFRPRYPIAWNRSISSWGLDLNALKIKQTASQDSPPLLLKTDLKLRPV